MRRLTAVVLAAAVAAPVAAQAADSASSLAALQAKRGADFGRQRDRLLDELRGDAAAQGAWAALLARLPAQAWRSRLLAEAMLLHLAAPDVGGAVDRLGGLDPGRYLGRRLPAPQAADELRRAAVPASVLVERWIESDGAVALRPRTAYPARFADAEVTGLQRREVEALREALLWAVGGSGHPDAVPFLAEVLAGGAPAPLRRTAALALGLAGDAALPVLAPTLMGRDPGLAAAAAAGVARLRSEAAIDVLIGAARRAPTPEARRAAAVGLGTIANRRSWGETDRPDLRARAARQVAAALARADAGSAALLVEAVAAADHPEAWAAVTALAADPGVEAPLRARAEAALRLREIAAGRARR